MSNSSKVELRIETANSDYELDQVAGNRIKFREEPTSDPIIGQLVIVVDGNETRGKLSRVIKRNGKWAEMEPEAKESTK